MSTYLAALHILLLQTLSIDPYQPFNTLYEKSKGACITIYEGAQETWQDVSEVVEEVSQELSQKIKNQYAKVTTDIDVKKYIVHKIGTNEISFFQLVRKIDNAINPTPEIRAWLSQKVMPDIIHNHVIIQEFTSHIDLKIQEQTIRNAIYTLHKTQEFQDLFHEKNCELKAFRFETLFAFYASKLLEDAGEAVDIISGISYAKMFLKAELGL